VIIRLRQFIFVLLVVSRKRKGRTSTVYEHRNGDLYIGGKLGDHVKIIFLFLDVGKMKNHRLTVIPLSRLAT